MGRLPSYHFIHWITHSAHSHFAASFLILAVLSTSCLANNFVSVAAAEWNKNNNRTVTGLKDQSNTIHIFSFQRRIKHSDYTELPLVLFYGRFLL